MHNPEQRTANNHEPEPDDVGDGDDVGRPAIGA